MNKILKIEINRLLDILCELKNHTTFDAYIKELRNLDNLPYTELKYYLEQVKHTLETFDDGYSWGVELNVVNNEPIIFNDVMVSDQMKNDQSIDTIKNVIGIDIHFFLFTFLVILSNITNKPWKIPHNM